MIVTLIKVFAGIGFVLLLAATAILGWLNRGERIYLPLATAAFTGVATALVTLFASLKGSELRDEFVTSAVLQTSDGRAPILFPTMESPAVGLRLASLASLINSPAVPISARKNSEDRTSIVLEALQYHIVRTILDAQGGGWSVMQTGNTVIPKVTPGPPTRVDLATLTEAELEKALRSNRFSAVEPQPLLWKHRPLKLPSGTRLRLSHVPSSPRTGVEKRFVILERTGFYTFEVKLEPMGGPHGAVPPGVEMPPNTDASDLRCEFVRVTVTQEFNKWTSASQRTEEYMAWTAWLRENLRTRLADM